jgi:fumarylpyruvate hydrolase
MTPIDAASRRAANGRSAAACRWQNANLNQMIWNVAEQISKLSQAFELMPGDIIFSGTPENVGPVVAGDVMEGFIAGLPTLNVKVV